MTGNAVKIVWVSFCLLVGAWQMPALAGAAAGPAGLRADLLTEWSAIGHSQGGKLLLSDSPEMVPADGILYQDAVEGDARLFFYHVNDTKSSKQMEVILENTGAQAATVAVRQFGLGGPGYAWMLVGKEAMAAYFAGSQPYNLQIPPHGMVSLSTLIGETAVQPNMLINGIFDFFADRQVQVKVLMLPMFVDVKEYLKTAKILPADEVHLRGSFAGMNREIVPLKHYDSDYDGPVALTLADNGIDPYLKGVDAVDGSAVVNYGNYGVMYQLAVPFKGKHNVACFLSPQGGEYAGAVALQVGGAKQKTVLTPAGRLYFGGYGTNDFALLGTYSAKEALQLTFSPPGASNLPVRIVLVPQ